MAEKPSVVSGRESPDWHLLESEPLCETPYLSVSRERIATPSRPHGVSWMVVRRPTAAVVAPRTAGGKFLLIRQERVAVRRTLWEFPAGQVDGRVTDAAIRETALRELGEEAGVDCRGELVPLGRFYSSPGFTDECCHLFLATDVVPRAAGTQPDEHEAILEIRTFAPDELRHLVASGEIVDANTLSLCARLQARGLLA